MRLECECNHWCGHTIEIRDEEAEEMAYRKSDLFVIADDCPHRDDRDVAIVEQRKGYSLYAVEPVT